MPKPNLVKFDNLAGIPCYYARVNAAYGDLKACTKSRVRQLEPGFLQRLNACIMELRSIYGSLEAITSGGAYVNKLGWHAKGQAYDLGGLHFTDRVLTCLSTAHEYYSRGGPDTLKTAWGDYTLYLGVEAIVRRHFGTVLGLHYDKHHRNHWHIDPGTKVGYVAKGFGATTRVRYLQETLKWIWGIDVGRPDGDEGPNTRAGKEELAERLYLGQPLEDVETWRQFLLLTALQAIWLQ